jgi:hypothetical protein
MLNLAGTHIGGWCERGCVYVLQLVNPPYPPGCVALYRGYMQLVQGGDPNYGQVTPIEVACDGINYFVSRDCGGGIIQTSAMSNESAIMLSGTLYRQVYGPSDGPGTGGVVCSIRVLS